MRVRQEPNLEMAGRLVAIGRLVLHPAVVGDEQHYRDGRGVATSATRSSTGMSLGFLSAPPSTGPTQEALPAVALTVAYGNPIAVVPHPVDGRPLAVSG